MFFSFCYSSEKNLKSIFGMFIIIFLFFVCFWICVINCKLRKYIKVVKKRVLVVEVWFEKKGGYIVEDIVVDILLKFYFINLIEFGIFLDKEDKEIVKVFSVWWDSVSVILLLY